MNDLQPPQTIGGTEVMVAAHFSTGGVVLVPVDPDDDRTWFWAPPTGEIEEIDP